MRPKCSGNSPGHLSVGTKKLLQTAGSREVWRVSIDFHRTLHSFPQRCFSGLVFEDCVSFSELLWILLVEIFACAHAHRFEPERMSRKIHLQPINWSTNALTLRSCCDDTAGLFHNLFSWEISFLTGCRNIIFSWHFVEISWHLNAF